MRVVYPDERSPAGGGPGRGCPVPADRGRCRGSGHPHSDQPGPGCCRAPRRNPSDRRAPRHSERDDRGAEQRAPSRADRRGPGGVADRPEPPATPRAVDRGSPLVRSDHVGRTGAAPRSGPRVTRPRSHDRSSRVRGALGPPGRHHTTPTGTPHGRRGPDTDRHARRRPSPARSGGGADRGLGRRHPALRRGGGPDGTRFRPAGGRTGHVGAHRFPHRPGDPAYPPGVPAGPPRRTGWGKVGRSGGRRAGPVVHLGPLGRGLGHGSPTAHPVPRPGGGQWPPPARRTARRG